jgi:hypothetical protein
MKLYHGTNAKHLNAILKDGLKPRGKKAKGNWRHTMSSCPDAIYLTDAYAVYFAWTATRDGDDMLIIEIDTDRLDFFNLVPDEDFLEQASRKSGPAPLDKSMKYRTSWYRRRLMEFSENWINSIKHLGTCAYMRSIPPEAITRYAIIPGDRTSELVMAGMDPSISLMNYHIMGEKYRNWVRWAFGDPLEGETEGPFAHAYMSKLARDGIVVVEREGETA